MIYAEILAGGKGTRMGNTEMPKQFLLLGNKPIFIHTVEQFLLNRRVDKILICCPEQWMAYTRAVSYTHLYLIIFLIYIFSKRESYYYFIEKLIIRK